MYCTNCGKKVEPGERFCSECGKPVEEAEVIKKTFTPSALNRAKKFSPAIFVVIIICFFLPFINVSCQGQKVATFTGIQLVTGTTIEQPSMFGEEEQAEKVEGEPLAILVLVSAVVGFCLSFLKNRKSAIAPAITGVAGLILLLLLKSKLDNDILRQGQGMLQVECRVGFWLTLLLFLFAVGLNAFVFLQRKKETKNTNMTKQKNR
jgi:uncharacterized membrane protein AbrB (regulator of aidB expression)